MNVINVLGIALVVLILMLLDHIYLLSTFSIQKRSFLYLLEAVWDGLMDETQYLTWNTVLVPIDGTIGYKEKQ